MEPIKNKFLQKYPENGDFNQYWYSQNTIESIVEEIALNCSSVACLSTPSIYFSLPSELKSSSWVLDLDDQFRKEKNYFKYDFNKPEDIPKELHNKFDGVVIDPPFITENVWRKYGEAARLLLKEGGKVFLSTVAENDKLLFEIFQAKPCAFQPSIPQLIYQYNFFTNFEPKVLSQKNPEIPDY
mmetsp:Transcript_303/g.333  ORF Transcript_303/g.333 Transcript_303/m.333 type:complete len:184 (-) Transcript_303:147-698(-)